MQVEHESSLPKEVRFAKMLSSSVTLSHFLVSEVAMLVNIIITPIADTRRTQRSGSHLRRHRQCWFCCSGDRQVANCAILYSQQRWANNSVFEYIRIICTEYIRIPNYSVLFKNRIIFVFVFGWNFQTEYIRIRIRFQISSRIYSYSYSVRKKFE